MPIIGSVQALRKSNDSQGPKGLRPLLVEVLLGVGVAALYWWEVDSWHLLREQAPPSFTPSAADLHAATWAYASHVLLIWFMLVASLVDIDEQSIPDLVTVPGTCLGLALAAWTPLSRSPEVVQFVSGWASAPLSFASPHPWPVDLVEEYRWASLAVALAIFWTWCVVLLPWHWHLRRGWRFAVGLMAARMQRDTYSKVLAVTSMVVTVLIAAVWLQDGPNWISLLSALVGLAVGGGLIWSVRVAAGWALGREAMGFGDVTLMAMIGSFIGWQACPIVFFLAPLAGIVVGLVQWFLYRDNVIPYGPFLCLATLVVIVRWGSIWSWAAPLYDLPWLVPGALIVCLALLTGLLSLSRLFRRLLGA